MRKPSSGFTTALGLIARVLPVLGFLIELGTASGHGCQEHRVTASRVVIAVNPLVPVRMRLPPDELSSCRAIRVGDLVFSDPLANDDVDERLLGDVLQVMRHGLACREAHVGASFQLMPLRAKVQHCCARDRIQVLFLMRVPMTRLRVRARAQFHQADSHLGLPAYVAEGASTNLAVGALVPGFCGNIDRHKRTLDRNGIWHFSKL